MAINSKLARQLALDELFDLTLYERLRQRAQGPEAELLDSLIPTERKHVAFWQQFAGKPVVELNLRRRIKLGLMLIVAQLFGQRIVHLILESIEIYGIQKYFKVWDTYKDAPEGQAIREILEDEFEHEDVIVSRHVNRRIDGEKIRNIFLGLNDGLVEMMGAVSGFFAAFQSSSSVLVASFMVAVAGAFSMAAGVYVSSGSEREVQALQERKRAFVANEPPVRSEGTSVITQAFIVGIAYLGGSMVPIAPVFFGARSVFLSVVAAGSMIVVVSILLSFISGMNLKRRVVTNVIITAAAVIITYSVGTVARLAWGISLP